MTVAEVSIWGRLVGAVAWDDARRLATFEYTPAFRSDGWDLAPLTMPRTAPDRLFEFPALRARDDRPDAFRGLPGLLADSLPDDYGNRLLDAWLARQGRAPGSMNPVESLCFIGSRGMGALEFRPVVPRPHDTGETLEVDDLVRTARDVLAHRSSFHASLDGRDEEQIERLIHIGTSAGGARPKAVIALNEDTGAVRSGQIDAPDDFRHWLIKLDGVSDVQLGRSSGFGRVEMAYHRMAVDCGIDMEECRLHVENGRAHFMTRRFDRGPAGERHHVQTLCALRHIDFNLVGAFSYEQVFETMRMLHLTYADAEQMFRRMVFNVVARNCDDHTRNFAFMLQRDGDWSLAPAYDLCHAYRPDSPWVSRHALTIGGKRDGFTRHDLRTIGRSIRCKQADDIIDQVQDVVGRWADYASAQQVDDELVHSIARTHWFLDTTND